MSHYAELSEEQKCLKRARAALWNRTHKDRRNARLRRWCKDNPESRWMRYWKHRLKKKYGLTPQDYEKLLIFQGYECFVCGGRLEPPSPTNRTKNGKSVVVDHIEGTKKVRGLLHNDCNRAIGFLKHNPIIMRRAAWYVERFMENESKP